MEGQTAIANPLYGTTTIHVAALAVAWGDDVLKASLEQLEANGVRVASSNGEVKRLVAAGQVAFGVADTDDAAAAQKEGAPVDVVYPDQDGLGTLVLPQRDERIAAVLGRVGLADQARRYPGELSGGERQRVAIARALVLEPRAILFDEPLSNLDVGLKRELLALLHELLAESRATAVYVTHDPREARALGDTTAVLDAGHLVHVGRLDALSSRPDLPLARLILEELG